MFNISVESFPYSYEGRTNVQSTCGCIILQEQNWFCDQSLFQTPGWERKLNWRFENIGLVWLHLTSIPVHLYLLLAITRSICLPYVLPFCFLNRNYSSFHEYVWSPQTIMPHRCPWTFLVLLLHLLLQHSACPLCNF